MLMVKRSKKDSPFHPRLRLRSTGYCPSGHWCGLMFRGDVEVGLSTIHEHSTVASAVQYYLSELKRTRHEPV